MTSKPMVRSDCTKGTADPRGGSGRTLGRQRRVDDDVEQHHGYQCRVARLGEPRVYARRINSQV